MAETSVNISETGIVVDIPTVATEDSVANGNVAKPPPRKKRRIEDPECRLDSSLDHQLVKPEGMNQNSRKYCRACSLKNQRIKCSRQCKVCKIALCDHHLRNCFYIYHTISDKQLRDLKK